MNFLKHSHNLKSGFSVIEILVGVFIVMLIVMAAYSFQKNIFSLNKINSDSLTIQDEAQRALKVISSEIRSASSSNLGAYPLVQTGTSSFIFYRNVDGDSFKERVRYFIDGTTLKKGVVKPSGTPLTYNLANEVISELIHNVANGATPAFNYYDANYDGTTQPLAEPIDVSKVRLVKINIIIDQDPQAPPSAMTFTTQISLRNLKDNL